MLLNRASIIGLYIILLLADTLHKYRISVARADAI